MGKPEGRVEKALKRRVEHIGGEIRKAAWIGRHSCPDRFCMVPWLYQVHIMNLLKRRTPRNPWVECKAPGEVANDAQAREHKRMRGLGELVLDIDTLELIDLYFPVKLP